jgi:hypothetical protein
MREETESNKSPSLVLLDETFQKKLKQQISKFIYSLKNATK